MSVLLMILLFATALFLIVLVLIQRGKGGGLAGAFGGMGGQSAFGTKAGDLFTRITIGVAAFWILLCIFAVYNRGGASTEGPLDEGLGGNTQDRPGLSAPDPSQPTDGESQAPAAPSNPE